MGNLLKWLKWVFDWRYLPAKFQHWLFSTGTHAVKFLNSAGLLGFSLVLFGFGDILYRFKFYSKFETAPPEITAGVMLVLSLLQIVSMIGKTSRFQIIGGYILICSGLVWFLIAIAFGAIYPPLSTNVVFPVLLALVCPLAGDNLIKLTKQNDMGNEKGA